MFPVDILHQSEDFLPVSVSRGSADLCGEDLHNLPVHPLAVVGQFFRLPFVVLTCVGTLARIATVPLCSYLIPLTVASIQLLFNICKHQ